MKEIVQQAFIETRKNFSADRVVADSTLNSEFIRRCKELGSSATDVELNFSLLNLRKAGLMKGLARATITTFKDDYQYRHASEVAVHFLEKRDATNLDRIICDPIQAVEFDSIAAQIAPGFSSLQYRWAALTLRKTRVLRPELLSRVVRPAGVTLGTVDNLCGTDLPNEQGLYVFYSAAETLYVGEASNLRRRVAKHLDHSDNRSLARWFWSNGFGQVRLELQLLTNETPTPIRKALEAELISSRRPLFNVQRLLVH